MKKFITLKVFNLRLEDIGGLISETVVLTASQTDVIGVVASAKLQTLIEANDMFHTLMNKQRGSLLTPQIKEKDTQRGRLFSEIKCISKVAKRSSLPNIAAAGIRMVAFLQPFWKINKIPMISKTDQINLLADRYAAEPALAADAITLGVSSQIESLFTVNTALSNLYNTRLNEMAILNSPSASSIRNDVVKKYNAFCVSIRIILSALPTEALQKLFNEMNDIRRKYISRLPTPLDSARTSVAPIAEQIYTGKYITPLPRVFFQTDKELRELVFAQDFTVTYRNNIEIGESMLCIHGKGKYIGSYTSTFHIIADN